MVLTGVRTPRLFVLALVALSVACSSAAPAAEPRQPAPVEPAFGTLVSDVERTAAEAQHGVMVAMVELSWQQAEPRRGRFDEEYLRAVQDEVTAHRTAGRSVTLGLGLHMPPSWLLDLPDSRLVDDTGTESDEPNLVFNQQLRDFAERYLGEVAQQVDLRRVDAVRLTSGGMAEVLYPDGGRYWAFDRHARNGPDLPDTMAPNPAPDGRPGRWRDEPQARAWAQWYVDALVDVVEWQLDAFGRLGFRGSYEVLTPGVGVRPWEFDDAVRDGLGPGVLGAGAAWQLFYSRLPRRPDLVAYVSSVADGSGDNDGCEPGDDGVAVTSREVEDWSAARWVARVARAYGYPVSGENAGWQQDFAPDSFYRDPGDDGMMAVALRQAHACGFRTFYWAHDAQLWDGTVAFDSYTARIAAGSK
jgi:glycosyl hydrolase family 42 (putative beta-galactosidase)